MDEFVLICLMLASWPWYLKEHRTPPPVGYRLCGLVCLSVEVSSYSLNLDQNPFEFVAFFAYNSIESEGYSCHFNFNNAAFFYKYLFWAINDEFFVIYV